MSGVVFNVFFGNTKGIQREYAAREARRGKIDFGGWFFLLFKGNTKGIQREYAAREARRGKMVVGSVFKEIQREYKGNTRRAKRAAEEIGV